MKFKKSIWSILPLHIVIFTLLSQVYFWAVVPLYEYQGFVDNFNILKLWVALSIIFISVLFIRREGMPSNFFLHMTLALIVTPSMVLYYGSDLPNEFALLTVFSFVVIVSMAGNVKVPTIKFLKIGNTRMMAFLASLSVLFVASLFVFGAGQFLNFDLSLVYDLRRDAANSLPDIYTYFTSFFPKIIIPFGIVIALIYHKWTLVFILSLCSIMIFALTAHKSPMIYPFIIIMVYWIAGKKNIVSLFLLFIVTGIILSAMDFWLLMNLDNPLYGWFGSIICRRAFLIPSELNWQYFDFFSANPYYFWSQSKITFGLIEPPFDLTPTKLIGEVFLGNPDASANTGWIGSGFANAGYTGSFVYSCLIGLFFSFLDAYSRKLGVRIVITLFVVPVLIMITSTDLLTMLLTHGLIVAIILLMSVKGVALQEHGDVVR